jgi:hypothetical protein
MNQVIMSVRSFDEGKVLRPFRLVVNTIKASIHSLSYIMLVVVVTSVVIMLIYGQVRPACELECLLYSISGLI